VLEIIKDTLTANDYTVDVASDGDSFRKAITEGAYSVIILDVNVPGMSGDKMALYVHQFLNPPVPGIILHSGIEEEALGRLAAEVKADDYLCKGCSDEHLLEVVKAVVDATGF
jgi:two-component system, OmpR family, response regulator VanR